MPTDHDIEFMKAFFGTLGMLALGFVAFCIIVPLVLNLPRFLSDIGLEICRRWFPDLVPEQYRRKPE